MHETVQVQLLIEQLLVPHCSIFSQSLDLSKIIQQYKMIKDYVKTNIIKDNNADDWL